MTSSVRVGLRVSLHLGWHIDLRVVLYLAPALFERLAGVDVDRPAALATIRLDLFVLVPDGDQSFMPGPRPARAIATSSRAATKPERKLRTETTLGLAA